MYSRIDNIGTVEIKNEKSKQLYFAKIYAKIIDKGITKFYLGIKPYGDNNCITIPILSTKENIKNSKIEFVSELIVKNSTEPTSFITSDIRDLMENSALYVTESYKYFEILDIFTKPEYRNNKFASILLEYVIKFIMDSKTNAVIFTYAGVSSREYIEEPPEKDFPYIIDKVTTFYEKNGFIDVNSFSDFESGKHMVYLNEITSKPLVTTFINLYDNNRYYNSSKKNTCKESLSRPKEPKLREVEEVNPFNKIINSISKIFKPKMHKYYDVEYNLNYSMCNVVEAANKEDAIKKAHDLMENMSKEEQIDRFLDAAEGGFTPFEITDVETGQTFDI